MKNKYKAHEFRSAVSEFAHKLHGSLRLSGQLRVTWTGGISTAGVNHYGEMFLSDIADDKMVSHATLVKYCGFVVHELCHTRWTDFSARTGDAYLGQLHNAVEDAWIEHNAIKSNLTGNVTELLTTLVNNMTDEAIKTVSDWSDPRQYPFMLAIYLRDHATTKTPMPDALKPIFAGAKERLNCSGNSTYNLAVAEWVYAQLKALPQSNDKPKNAPQNDDKGSTSPDQGSDEGEGAGQPSSPSDEVGEAKAPSLDTAPVCVEPSLENGEEVEAGGANYSEDSYVVETFQMSQEPVRTIAFNVSGKLRHEVKRLFDNSGREDWQRGRKSGTFNVSALHNIGSTDRLFKRRHETEGIDSAVVICLDVSGSMGGSSMGVATSACAALLDSLTKAGVSTSILTFSNYTTVLKDFNAPTRRAINDLARVKSFGGTNDYFAVRYAHTLLSKRHEQRKVCLVLSDGDGYVLSTRRQCEVGERIGITTLGIGIRHDVDNVYDKNVTIHNLADLGNATFKHIKLAV
jgi:Mg-chelatase subunit ChlD